MAAGQTGYHIDVAGAVEDSSKGSASIVAGIPIMLFITFTLLMLQLQSFSRAIMGGLMVATVLTLLALPAMYAAWFRVRRDAPAAG